ncbi:MAG TPA: HAMP domain-containing sensor histidine kinase [Acidimicrobiia bacterium]|nr:HAMP domain-containing sensor histidine kinase [Acidimicrobiia bacterium]
MRLPSLVRHNAMRSTAALLVLLVLAAAVSFARADQTDRVAREALMLRETEYVIGQTATLRASLAIALVASASYSTDATEVVRRAALTARQSVEDMTNAERALRPEDRQTLDVVGQAVDQFEALLLGGEIDTADELLTTSLLPPVREMVDGLSASSAEIAARIELEQAEAGRIARLSSFTVALVAPALAVLLFRRAARRRLEEQRLAAELRSERELAEARDDLIAGLSHELRTPLTGIQGFAAAVLEASRRGGAPAELVEEGMSTILGETGELSRMIDDLLVAARADTQLLAFRVEPTPVAEVIEDVILAMRETGTTVASDCAEAMVAADPGRLRHIVRNLLANATTHGGPNVAVLGIVEHDHYLLTVIDDGQGVPPEMVTRLFQSFAHPGKTATVKGSLGLGLAVVATLARHMGADVGYAREGGSSRFTVILPLAATRQSATAIAAGQA